MDGALGQMAVVALGLLGGMVLAWALFTFLGSAARSARHGIARARGPERPVWAPGIWHCAGCYTTNPPTATRCARCRRPREELVHAPIEARRDWIPATIVVPPDVIVTLVHDPAAHADPGAAHWRLTAGGQTVGSAARRDGAVALLRALDGVREVAFDRRGTGPTTYRLAEVIARFEAAGFPLDVPCPERTG
jgi:hypothetical protein